MFKKTQTKSSKAYAFSQPTAHSSSASVRKEEAETFYQPLPTPSSPRGDSTSALRGYNNPFSDPSRPASPASAVANYPPRTPSPSNNASPSTALLAGQSPVRNTFQSMPDPSRNYAPPRQGGMPARGDSQSALLGKDRQVSGVVPVLVYSNSSEVCLSSWQLQVSKSDAGKMCQDLQGRQARSRAMSEHPSIMVVFTSLGPSFLILLVLATHISLLFAFCALRRYPTL
jgi:hypothetical protein